MGEGTTAMGRLLPTSYAGWVRATERALAEGCAVRATRRPGWFRVSSGSVPRRWYDVGPTGCSCPATGLCKHLSAVIYVHAPAWGDGVVRPPDDAHDLVEEFVHACVRALA